MCVCVPMPTHCTNTRFGFHARQTDGIECGLFSIRASLGQTTLLVGQVCVFGFKGASTSKVIGARNEIMMDGYGGQMIFGDLVGLNFLTFVLQVRKNPEKNFTQETCPNRGSNPGPLRDKRACYHLFHSGRL